MKCPLCGGEHKAIDFLLGDRMVQLIPCEKCPADKLIPADLFKPEAAQQGPETPTTASATPESRTPSEDQ
jgi:hypothetical protein